jgi:ubiquinone/menaquinone biosynthesis C-methylase UbiE
MVERIFNVAPLVEVEEGIFSCFPASERASSYDNKVNAYDMVVGNRFYNRFIWGNWPSAYRKFCLQALESSQGGTVLDAGCGSLVFTAGVYAEAENKLIILLDRSIGMLVKGRDRISKIKGFVPSNIVFVQGDIFDLPFKNHVFDTVVSFGVLHMFDDKYGLLTELERVKRDGGHLHYSSLVGNNAIGRKYLEILKQAGEVATCHSSESLDNLISKMPFEHKSDSIGNMAYFRSV